MQARHSLVPLLLSLGLSLLVFACAHKPAVREDINLGALPSVAGHATYANETRPPKTDLEKELIALYERQGKKVVLNRALERAACTNAILYQYTLTMPWDTIQQRILWRSGYSGRYRGGRYLKATEKQLADHLEAPEVGDTTGVLDIGFCRYGKTKRRSQVILVGERNVTFDAFPKRVNPGETVEILGRFEVPVKQPFHYATAEGIGVTKAPLAVQPDGSFRHAWQAPSTPGVYYFEIVGLPPEVEIKDKQLHWRKSYADGAVFIGVEESKLFGPDERPPRENPPAEQWGAMVQDRVNALRTGAGLPPILGDPNGLDIARDRAEEAARNKELGPDPTLNLKFARRGVALGAYHQQQASFEFLSQWLDTEESMPTFREMVFNRDLDRMAVGFAVGRGSYATVGYYYQARPLITKDMLESLRSAISDKAKSKGFADFGRNPRVDAWMEQTVNAICAENTRYEEINDFMSEKLKSGGKDLGINGWNSQYVLTSGDLHSSGLSDALPTDEGMTNLTIGSCRGNFGENHPLGDLLFVLFYHPEEA